jgi:hypothetical protein
MSNPLGLFITTAAHAALFGIILFVYGLLVGMVVQATKLRRLQSFLKESKLLHKYDDWLEDGKKYR